MSVRSSFFPITPFRLCYLATLMGLLVTLSNCGFLPKDTAEAQPEQRNQAGNQLASVDVQIARTGTLQEAVEYTGTTNPLREVSVRPQIEARLLNLTVDVGDPVEQGQPIAQLDDALLRSALMEAQAELASRQSEVARAETQVSNALTGVEEARLQLQQAQADAARLEPLAREGAISAQAAQQQETAARTAEQALRSAEAQVAAERRAVEAAKAQVSAQQAIIEQERERLSYTMLNSPITGVITQRLTEPGNLLQPGSEILKIGDFGVVKVVVNLSELELSKIRVGQDVQVKIDAFPNEELTGTVTRISPAADASARLVPVEITIPNSNGRIGSGLLARVSFSSQESEQVIVPETALRVGGGGGRGQRNQGNQGNQNSARNQSQNSKVFVIQESGETATVAERSVQLGERANGQVAIISGLQAGDRFVVRSGKPLKNGDTVRLSILSEK
jgi:HlyD family secretion protein